MFAEAIENILQDHCTPAAVRAIEAGASAAPLAATLEESGFHALLASEEQGGGNASWPDFHRVVELCGAYALPLPLPQTMAARALVHAPEALPPGLITFAPHLARRADGRLHAALVPAGRNADFVLAETDSGLLLLPTREASQQADGVHGSLVTSFSWAPDAGTRLEARVGPGRLQALAAALHAALLAGAMKRVFDMTMEYANDRVQFGKPIGSFQAVKHHLADVAVKAEFAEPVIHRAAYAVANDWPQRATFVSQAKLMAGEAARLSARHSIQVHGAMGYTWEADLQMFVKRAWALDCAYGDSIFHKQRVAGQVLGVDARLGPGESFAGGIERPMKGIQYG